MNVLKAIYNFLVGDMIILIGILAVILVLILINNVNALTPLRDFTGAILITAVLSVLTATLAREAIGKR